MKYGRTLAALTLLMSTPVSAYVLTTDTSARNKTWSSAAPEFFTHTPNNSSLSTGTLFTIITNALHYWKYGGTAGITFDYWQGSSTVNPVVSYDGRNVISFLSRNSSVAIGSGVIGVTYMYSSGSSILETDIVFNDRDFYFTNNPSDTTNLTGSASVFLGGVAAHELGHAYGLSHSNSLQSTMMWQEARGQFKPSCDDLSGIAALYPLGAYTNQTGQISGSIRDATGSIPVFGAHVQAISRKRGVVLASAISTPTGTFTISNLEPGAYYLLVEPFTNAVSSLCGGSSSGCYFGGANASTICTGSLPFKRFFTESSVGFPSAVNVTAGVNTAAGLFNVSCSAMTLQHANVTAAARAPAMMNAAVVSGGSVFGVFSAVNDVHYYKISNVPNAASVKATAMAFSLYSKADVTLQILQSDGVTPYGTNTADVFTNATNYVNYDSSAEATTTSAADIFVKVTYLTNFNTAGNLAKYPGYSSIDSTPYYQIIVTVNDTAAIVQVAGLDVLTQNARCEKSYPSNTYSDRGTPPAIASSSSASSSGSGGGLASKVTGGCGTVRLIGRHRNQDHDDDDSGPGAAALFSAWGILVMLILSRLAFKSTAR